MTVYSFIIFQGISKEILSKIGGEGHTGFTEL